jgi:hypothetical protein
MKHGGRLWVTKLRLLNDVIALALDCLVMFDKMGQNDGG